MAELHNLTTNNATHKKPNEKLPKLKLVSSLPYKTIHSATGLGQFSQPQNASVWFSLVSNVMTIITNISESQRTQTGLPKNCNSFTRINTYPQQGLKLKPE